MDESLLLSLNKAFMDDAYVLTKKQNIFTDVSSVLKLEQAVN